MLSNQNEQVALAMKVYRCLQIDVSKDRIAQGIYGSKVPRFITFDGKGKQDEELYVQDYATSSKPLLKVLMKTARGHGDLPLMTFVKKYRSFLNEVDQLEGKKSTLAAKKDRLVKSGKNVSSLDKETAVLEKQEKTLVAQEVELLKAVKAYECKTPDKKAVAAAAASGGG